MPEIRIITSREINDAGGVLSARYYIGRKEGETYREWLERDELDEWIARRIEMIELRLGTGAASLPKRKAQTPLGKLKRELYLHELALLRMRARCMREEME